ncbi:MAG: VWA domain-containing protein, partial [Planctomycetes bacterium]|nr:VWA domain-containing protein [Planctomycetota bacterium]
RTPGRPKSSPSLWLECLAAVLAALWLSGMTFGGLVPRHVLVVLDDSASMASAATRAGADRALRALADDLGADDRVTVVRSGEPASVAVGPRARPAQFEAFVTGWSPAQPDHPLRPAFDLARQFAGTVDEVVCVTDRPPLEPADDLRVIACGQPAANAAITSLQRLPGDGGERLRISLAAYGAVPAGELVVTAGERQLARAPFSPPSDGAPVRVEVALPPGTGEVEVALPDDALAVDNVAWSLPARARVVAVCDQLAPATRSALALDRVFEAMVAWRDEPRAEQAQVVLRERPAATHPGELQLVFGPADGERRGHRGPFVVDRSCDLLAGVSLDGVAWQSGGRDLPGRVLIASGAAVLMSEELTEQGRRIHLDVDGAAGNLVRAPDWPILFANVLEAARREVPGCAARELRVGDELRCRAGPGDGGAVLFGPGGERLAAATGGRIVFEPRAPGVYRLRAASGAALDEAAVRFVDAHESDLRGAESFDRPAARSVRAAAAARVDPSAMRQLLAVLLLMVVLTDWWLLHRRGA